MADVKISFPGVPAEAIETAFADANSAYRSEEEGTNRKLLTQPYYGPKLETLFANAIKMRYSMSSDISVDHLVLGNWKLLEDDGINRVELFEATTAWSAFNSVHYDNTPSGGTIGQGDRYYLGEFAVATEDHWQVHIWENPTSARDYTFQTLHISQWFTPANSLDEFLVERADEINPFFVSSDQSVWDTRVDDERYRFRLTWKGVTDANIETLETKLQKDYNTFVFLYAETDSAILAGENLRHCKITDYRYRKVFDDWNILVMEFEELP